MNYYCLKLRRRKSIFPLRICIFLVICGASILCCQKPSDNSDNLEHLYKRLDNLAVLDLQKNYNVLTNASSPLNAQVIIFGENHDSVEDLINFLGLGASILSSEYVVLHEQDESYKIPNNVYRNCFEYFVTEIFYRHKFKANYKVRNDPVLRGYAHEALSESLFGTEGTHNFSSRYDPWKRVSCRGWDLKKEKNEKEDQEYSRQIERNENKVKVIEDLIKEKKKIVIISGGLHVPPFQAGFSKWWALSKNILNASHPMMRTKSLGAFFHECKALPMPQRIATQCDMTYSIWNFFNTNNITVTFISAKRTPDINEKLRHEVEQIEKNHFVPTSF